MTHSANWRRLGFWMAAAASGSRLAFAEPSTSEVETLRSAGKGSVVRLPELAQTRASLPRIPVEITRAPGPQFLLSDRPEYFLAGDGIALQEEVEPGPVRLYIYHVPDPNGGPKTITAAVQNLGRESMALRLLRSAFPPPGTDYQRIAKEGLATFFDSTPEPAGRTVEPNGLIPLDPKLGESTARKDQLVHGFYEFTVSQRARVTVFQRDPGTTDKESLATLPKLPRTLPGKRNGSGAGRGRFADCNFTVTNAAGFVLDTTNGPMQLLVANGKTEGWIQGHDSIENADDARDIGNYGVLYRIHLSRASSDGRGLSLLLCKLSADSKWCAKLAAAIQVSAGEWPAGTVLLPADVNSFGEPGEMALVQKFPPLPKGRTEAIDILYSPPGAACIPTPLLFIPYSQ